jgi:hypothetical protein
MAKWRSKAVSICSPLRCGNRTFHGQHRELHDSHDLFKFRWLPPTDPALVTCPIWCCRGCPDRDARGAYERLNLRPPVLFLLSQEDGRIIIIRLSDCVHSMVVVGWLQALGFYVRLCFLFLLKKRCPIHTFSDGSNAWGFEESTRVPRARLWPVPPRASDAVYLGLILIKLSCPSCPCVK